MSELSPESLFPRGKIVVMKIQGLPHLRLHLGQVRCPQRHPTHPELVPKAGRTQGFVAR